MGKIKGEQLHALKQRRENRRRLIKKLIERGCTNHEINQVLHPKRTAWSEIDDGPGRVAGDCYRKRCRALLQLKFRSYITYLRSSLWSRIRLKAFLEHGRVCKLCLRDADVIHHDDYSLSTLSGKTLTGLVPMCHNCHKTVEFTEEGIKRSIVEARIEYRRLLAACQRA